MIEIRVKETIAAPIKEVWSRLRDFGDLSYFSPALKVELLDGTLPTQIGATRKISLSGDGVGYERLLGLSDLNHRLEYAYIDDPALPFSDYVAEVQLSADDEPQRTRIDWRARFALVGSDPESVKHFIEFGVIRECLAGLRRLLE